MRDTMSDDVHGPKTNDRRISTQHLKYICMVVLSVLRSVTQRMVFEFYFKNASVLREFKTLMFIRFVRYVIISMI